MQMFSILGRRASLALLLILALPCSGQFGNSAKKLQGYPICSTAPTTGQFLIWSAGNCWTPTTASAVSPASTDTLSEGSTNLYFTAARALAGIQLSTGWSDGDYAKWSTSSGKFVSGGSFLGTLAAGSLSGNTSKLATVAGTFTLGNAITVDANGNFADSGLAPGGSGGGSGSGTVNSGSAGQLAYYVGSGTAVSGTGALPNGTTATTQSQADASTKVATTAYVDSGLGGKASSSASTTVNGQACALGSTCTVTAAPTTHASTHAAAGGDPITPAAIGAATKQRAFGYAFNGSGSALTSGVTGYLTVPFACTIAAWNIAADAGTATVDVWKLATGTAIPTIGNTITASATPALATGTAIHSTTLTGWTTSVAANDVVAVNLKAVATATFVNLTVECDQ